MAPPNDKADAQAGSRFAMPPSLPVAGDPIFPLGEVLNDTFEIKKLIGAGGAGQVFEAHDRHLNRTVAIKALRNAAGGTATGALLSEGQALAALRHPGLVTVHSYGSHRGIDYIVMERVYGVSLDVHIAYRKKAGQLFSIPEVLDILIGIAEALRAVHRSGGAHRDIKPSNIMLTADGRCVLTDFGIYTPEATAQRPSVILGTPLYIAPETISNKVAPGAYHLVDLYALGVNAFEIITGRPPFEDANIRAILLMHLEAPVPDPGVLRPDTPQSLRKLTMDLMSKDPLLRPPGIDQVLWRLREVQDRGDARGTEPFSVLVVDDDADFVQALEQELIETIEGVELRTASDGIEALKLVREKPPNLMLLDLHMPGMSGLELCMHLRGTRRAERCTIVCISGRAALHDLEIFSRFGVTDFVPKGSDLIQRLWPVLKRLCPGRLNPAAHGLPPGVPATG